MNESYKNNIISSDNTEYQNYFIVPKTNIRIDGDGKRHHRNSISTSIQSKFVVKVNDLKQGRFLGNGAFGKVYDGEYKGVAVAIKWLEMEHARSKLGDSVSDEQIIESFDWEAMNLSLVNHPNIISLIGVYEDGLDRRGLVLELCDGMDLKKLLLENKSNERFMSTKEHFCIIFQLLNGLKYLHEKGIIHKDVKLENVLWFRDGRVKWADLGVSAVDSLVQENEAALSQAGMKDAYWNSPEEARIRLGIDEGASKVALKASDIFSFGLIIYAVVSGEGDIWKGSDLNSLREIQECLNEDNVIQVLSMNESWWCYDLLIKCFAYRPQDRPSASELLELLKEWAYTNHLCRILLSHELVIDIHSSAEDRRSYVENLCTMNKGDVNSFGSENEEHLTQLDRIFPLSHCVSNFIKGQVGQVLLLLGDGGTGKSTGMHMMAARMSNIRTDDEGPQFVFLRPRVEQWSLQSLCDVCTKIDGGKYVFVLDGYDELIGHSVDVGKSLPEYLGMSSDTHLIVTCRRNIVPENRISSVFGHRVCVRYLLPFTKNQIAQYLEICAAPKQLSSSTVRCSSLALPRQLTIAERLILQRNQSLFDVPRVFAFFNLFVRDRRQLPRHIEYSGGDHSVPRVAISNPFLLKLYASSWRFLRHNDNVKSESELEREMYDASVRAWFSEACGLEDEMKSLLSVESFEEFACHAAMAMFASGNRVAMSFPKDSGKTPDALSSSPWFLLEDRVCEYASHLFDARTSANNARRSVMSRDDFVQSKLQLLSTQFLHRCPLQKKPGTQLFSFIHKSYRDYFCGMAMTRMMNVYIDKVLVTSDVAVQRWASRFVDVAAARQHANVGQLSASELEESTFSIRALEFVERTRYVDPLPSLSIGAANCMTILNTAGVPFSGRDFRYAQLGDSHDESDALCGADQPFMDLGGAMLYGCDFSGANLSGARLQQACMDRAKFSDSNMLGVKFGEQPSFIGHSRWVSSLSISPDGEFLYSGSDDRSIIQWYTPTGEMIRKYESHTDDVKAITMSQDGRYLYSASYKTVKQWCTSSGELLRTFAEDGDVNGLCCTSHNNSDDMYVYSASGDNINQWATVSGKLIRTLEGHDDDVNAIVASSDGEYLYSGSSDRSVIQWCTLTGEILQVFEGHRGKVNAVCLTSCGGEYLYSGSDDCTIKQWHTCSGGLVRTINDAHVSGVKALVMSPCGEFLYSGSNDSTIKQWFVATSELMRTMTGHDGGVLALCVSKSCLYSGSYDRHIKQWSSSSVELSRTTMDGHGDTVNVLCVTRDGRFVYSGSFDNTVKQWATSTGELLRTFRGHRASVQCLCLSVCEMYLYSGSFDRTIKQWSISTGQLLRTIKGHSGGVTVVYMSLDGTLYSGSDDHTINMWTTSTNGLLYTLEGHTDTVNVLCVSRDGDYLYSGSFDRTIRQWSTRSRQLLRTLEGHDFEITVFCLSANGKYLFSGSHDHTVKQWNTKSGKLKTTLKGHNATVKALYMSPDGTLFSGSGDNRINEWCLSTGALLSTKRGSLKTSPVGQGMRGFEVCGKNIVEHEVRTSMIKKWSSPPYKLSAIAATLGNVKNLSPSNRRLLKQLNKPESDSDEGDDDDEDEEEEDVVIRPCSASP